MKFLGLLPVLFFATAAVAAAPKLYAGHELAGKAHVQLAEAQAIALKARPGRITDKELEKEAGGSGLRWSFDIKANGKGYEVGVDAADGKVLENKVEGSHPD
ncbi:PepSY domain-containing protein [Phenylobacterium sp.]|uniref:PepSY domain-containing protein n=1 Tax=Phenylobacterium sp. TaxID=1871053 RepID=UPI0025E3E804|nr:PepSY domain-containing protein [Phenylobacterium sp.]